MISFTITSNIVHSSSLTVPAQFVEKISLPGSNNTLLKPTSIYFDNHFNELYIVDKGHNRILIFDSLGNYRFEFYGNGKFRAPVDIAVDSEGYLYILAVSGTQMQLFKYDFDGKYITKIPYRNIFEGEEFDIRSLTLDDDDNIYLYDNNEKQILEMTTGGEYLGQFKIEPNLAQEKRKEIGVGSIQINNNEIFVPVSTYGSVHVYSKAGKDLRHVGYFGALPGELNFPNDVWVNNDGLIMVLDKRRYVVVCYAPDGKFLGEFGGRGFRDGWFYYPSLLTADKQGHVYVGQIYNNLVQKCSIPQFILDKLPAADSELEAGENNSADPRVSMTVRVNEDNLER